MILPIGELRFEIIASGEILSLLGTFFPVDRHDQEPAAFQLAISNCAENFFTVEIDGVPTVKNIKREQLVSAVVDCLVKGYRRFGRETLVQAAAVVWQNQTILILGNARSGKSSLAAWFVKCGFAHLADQYVLINEKTKRATGVLTPITLNFPSIKTIVSWPDFHDLASVESGQGYHIRSNPEWRPLEDSLEIGMVIDLDYIEGSSMSIKLIKKSVDAFGSSISDPSRTSAQPDSPWNTLDHLSALPSLKLQYGSFDQLDGKLDLLVQMGLEQELDSSAFSKFISGYGAAPTQLHTQAFDVQPATSRKLQRKLTIGMATYDDYDGVYFSIQAMRMYHPEVMDDVEFLVVDNHPDGPCGKPLKDLEVGIPNYRYVPMSSANGTAVARNKIFEEATGTYVLVMDCHVFLVPGALKKLMEYFQLHPDTTDLLQGPLLHDDLSNISTHFDPVWRQGMYGTWGNDARGQDPHSPPFEIQMQGLGVFASRRDSWAQFNSEFREFGGEEGYIHEKYRQRDDRTICLPFLRWMHRFGRPLGVPYPSTWEDRYRNYIIGHAEFGLDMSGLRNHMAELIGEKQSQGFYDKTIGEAEKIVSRMKLDKEPKSTPTLKEDGPRVLAFTCSRDRPVLLRHAALQMQAQTYPVDHSIYINTSDFADGVQQNANYADLLKDIAVQSDGKLKLSFGPSSSHHSNYMSAVEAVNIDDYDLFIQVDDDDIYLAEYVQTIVDDFMENNWDYSGSRSLGILMGENYDNVTDVPSLGLTAKEEALGIPEIMPPTLALSRKAVRALRDIVDCEKYHDPQWRSHLAQVPGMKMAVRDNAQFIYNVHGGNASTYMWLQQVQNQSAEVHQLSSSAAAQHPDGTEGSRNKPNEHAIDWKMAGPYITRASVLKKLLSKIEKPAYLEIGCDKNTLFDSIHADFKIGVDPKRGGTHRMTSDDFFAQNQDKFDVIFIDGLHIYNQVHRDVENALACLKPSGWICLHDMLPATAQVEHVPRQQEYWMGDVWKLGFELAQSNGVEFQILTADCGVGVARVPDPSKVQLKDLSAELGSERFSYLYKNRDKLPTIDWKSFTLKIDFQTPKYAKSK